MSFFVDVEARYQLELKKDLEAVARLIYFAQSPLPRLNTAASEPDVMRMNAHDLLDAAESILLGDRTQEQHSKCAVTLDWISAWAAETELVPLQSV